MAVKRMRTNASDAQEPVAAGGAVRNMAARTVGPKQAQVADGARGDVLRHGCKEAAADQARHPPSRPKAARRRVMTHRRRTGSAVNALGKS
jgi:hypothetical protein